MKHKVELKLNVGNLHNIVFYVLIFAIAVFFTVLSFLPKENKLFDSEPCYSLMDSCQAVSESGERTNITLPATLDPESDMTVTVEYKISRNPDKLYALCIRTSQQSLEVTYDGDIIYSFGMDKSKIAFGESPGSAYNIIRLPMNSAGKTVSFKITALDKYYNGVVNEIYAGTKASVLFFLIKDNFLNFVVAMLILILGIGLLSAGIVLRKALNGDRQLRYIGWFAVLMGLWLFAESKAVQFFVGNQLAVYLLAITCILLLIVPILQYVLTIEGYHYRKLIKLAIWYIYIDSVAIIALQLTNVFQFYETLLWAQIVRVIIILILLGTFCLELFKYKNKKMLAVGGAVLALCTGGILEFIKYQVARGNSVGEFIKMGTLLFVIILANSVIKRSIYISNLSREARYYEKMAKTDIMAKIQNRTAYIEDFEEISKTESWKTCAVVMADINDLKEINDYYGHHMGDDAIIRCSNCLKESFGEIGKCYRIGGDEFACIIPEYVKDDVERRMINFERKCMHEGENCGYAFEVAAGYAYYDASVDLEFDDIPKKADKNMYSRKQALKICKGIVSNQK